jgi:hypothetical protein
MIELDEVVQLVDPLPGDRLTVGLVAAKPLDLGARRLHDPVAAETQLYRRHQCDG